jgi:hypothetical protein
MIKICNLFKAIGSFVRKIKEKNTSAEMSHTGAEGILVPNCPCAEVSSIRKVKPSVVQFVEIKDNYSFYFGVYFYSV